MTGRPSSRCTRPRSLPIGVSVSSSRCAAMRPTQRIASGADQLDLASQVRQAAPRFLVGRVAVVRRPAFQNVRDASPRHARTRRRVASRSAGFPRGPRTARPAGLPPRPAPRRSPSGAHCGCRRRIRSAFASRTGRKAGNRAPRPRERPSRARRPGTAASTVVSRRPRARHVGVDAQGLEDRELARLHAQSLPAGPAPSRGRRRSFSQLQPTGPESA